VESELLPVSESELLPVPEPELLPLPESASLLPLVELVSTSGSGMLVALVGSLVDAVVGVVEGAVVCAEVVGAVVAFVVGAVVSGVLLLPHAVRERIKIRASTIDPIFFMVILLFSLVSGLLFPASPGLDRKKERDLQCFPKSLQKFLFWALLFSLSSCIMYGEYKRKEDSFL